MRPAADRSSGGATFQRPSSRWARRARHAPPGPERSAQAAIAGSALSAGDVKPSPSAVTVRRTHPLVRPSPSEPDSTGPPGTRQIAIAPPWRPTTTAGLRGRAAATPETRSIAAHGALRDGRTRANTAKPPPERPVQTATARPTALTATSGERGSPLRGATTSGVRIGAAGAGPAWAAATAASAAASRAVRGRAALRWLSPAGRRGGPRYPAGLREREDDRGTGRPERVLTLRPHTSREVSA